MEVAATDCWKRGAVELFLLREKDVTERYVNWLSSPKVNRYLESRFAIHTVETVRDFVRASVISPSSLLWGIRSAELGNMHLGNIKLAPIDRNHGVGEVGIMIGEEDAWGRGIGTDSIRIVMEIARHQLDLRKLTAGCYESNVGSQKSFERAGFEVVGKRPRHFLLDGHPEALVLMDCFLTE
jgi:[ribosomal protein S5]-alanine N-acetyltransferase